MKRFPNGIAGKPFYQHRAPDTRPPGVRVEYATSETETRPHIIGGSLLTLLYTVQLASISQDPWLSRVGSLDDPDHAALDLDPPPGAAFSRGGDTLFLAGDSTATFALVAVGASHGALLASRRLDYQPCAVATDTLGSWLYVAGVSTTSAFPRSLLQVYDRGTMNVVTTLHVKSDVLYGYNVCPILQNPLEHRVYVVDTWAGEPTVAARAQLYSFETPR